MNCAQVKGQLIDFLYEEMSAEARASFAEHLRGCPTCSADLASYQKTLGQARAALGGPLSQEPPARVHLAVLAAAKAAAAPSTPTKKPARADEPGFFARLLRTPWLLPAFGAASIATAVFLVRVLKNPEVIPGQQARSIDERAIVTPAPTAVVPTVPAEEQATAEDKLDESARAGVGTASRSKALRAKAIANTAAPGSGTAGTMLIKRKKAVSNDPLEGLRLDGPPASGGDPRFAEPPPPPSAKAAREKSLDDLLGSFSEERRARQPEAQPAQKTASKVAPTLSADPFAPSGGREKISKISSKQGSLGDEFAEPPLPSPAPTAKGAPRPVPQARTARAEVVSDDASKDSEDGRAASAESKAGKKPSDTGSTFEESVKKADRLYASQDWNAAAEAYRDLLRRFPGHKDTPKWRDRMNESNAAYQRTLEAKRKKAVTDDPLSGSKL